MDSALSSATHIGDISYRNEYPKREDTVLNYCSLVAPLDSLCSTSRGRLLKLVGIHTNHR